MENERSETMNRTLFVAGRVSNLVDFLYFSRGRTGERKTHNSAAPSTAATAVKAYTILRLDKSLTPYAFSIESISPNSLAHCASTLHSDSHQMTARESRTRMVQRL